MSLDRTPDIRKKIKKIKKISWKKFLRKNTDWKKEVAPNRARPYFLSRSFNLEKKKFFYKKNFFLGNEK